MRLWHYKLLPVLPDKFIIAEWRECIAIKRQWEKGTLKHRLVSYVMDYRKEYFRDYVKLVIKELKNRQININLDLYDEIWDFCTVFSEPISDVYYPEHNDRYLKQCYYNLQEKYDRGIISEDEWRTICLSDDLTNMFKMEGKNLIKQFMDRRKNDNNKNR